MTETSAREIAAEQQFSLWKRMKMGAGYLEGYGEHPGTEMLFVLCLMTACAGASGAGWLGFGGGLVIGLIFYVPIWLSGCVGRADAYLAKHPRAILQEPNP